MTESEDQKHQRRSPFKKFCQVNTDKTAMVVIDWLIKTSPLAYRILQFLVQNMDHYNAIVCSYKVLQEYFEVSQPSVARAIKLLKEYQFVYVVKSGTSNIYLVNKTLYWNSWGTNYANAKFGVSLVVSLSEQEEIKQKTILKQLQAQRECHLKDAKRLPPLSDAVLENLSQQPKTHYIFPSEKQESVKQPSIIRSPIILSPEEKRLLELML